LKSWEKQNLVNALKSIVPRQMLRFQRRLIAFFYMHRAKGKSAKDIFSEIYLKSQWGKSTDGFCSGWGSIDENATPYVEYVNGFISNYNIKSIVDLGCGDFKVGRRLEIGHGHYLGCDVVSEVIEENKKKISSDRVNFQCLDMINDILPTGQLCLVRQVFQHLSNADIQKIIPKLRIYEHVLISDVQVYEAKWTNLDIQTFSGTRTQLNSNLFIEMPPFDVPVTPVLEYPLTSNPEYYIRAVHLNH